MSGTTTERRPLGVGVLGTGAIAPPYFMALQAWPQLQLISCSSRGMVSARAVAQQYGIAAVEFSAMLADPAIDAVVNLTPIAVHFETGKAILEAGKHLYSEKPIAATAAQGKSVV